MAIASIGPTTTEALEEFGLNADITPTHPKMGFLVKETAEQAATILERKRAASCRKMTTSDAVRQVLQRGLPGSSRGADRLRHRLFSRQSFRNRVL